MNASMELDNADIQGTVRGFLDEILDCVEAETNWIEQLMLKLRRGLAQQVVDVLIREAIGTIDSLDSGAVDVDIREAIGTIDSLDSGAGDVDIREVIGTIDSLDSGAGDVDRLGARIHNRVNRQVLHTEQRHIIEGQLIGQSDLQNVFNSQYVNSHINRSRSLTLLPTCFKSNTAAPTGIKPSSSSKALPACSFNQEHHGTDEMSNGLCRQSDDSSSVSKDIDASNIIGDILEYPRYTKMKTVTTSRGEIRVPAYCFDDMEEIELDVYASKEILTDTDTKKESDKKIGYFSRVGKFFRRLCCCSVQEECD